MCLILLRLGIFFIRGRPFPESLESVSKTLNQSNIPFMFPLPLSSSLLTLSKRSFKQAKRTILAPVRIPRVSREQEARKARSLE